MKFTNIYDPSDGGTYHLFEIEDFEYQDPLQKFREISAAGFFMATRQTFEEALKENTFETVLKVFSKMANEEWEKDYQEILKIEVPDKLFKIFEARKKREQKKILSEITLSSKVLKSFSIKAGMAYGCTLSQYYATHNPSGLKEEELPIAAEVLDDRVHIVGNTTLSEKQLKQAIEHRSRKICMFIEKEEQWHCFFWNNHSITGKEQYQNGQPHLHYISNLWETDRAKVISELKKRNYSIPSLHVNYIR